MLTSLTVQPSRLSLGASAESTNRSHSACSLGCLRWSQLLTANLTMNAVHANDLYASVHLSGSTARSTVAGKTASTGLSHSTTRPVSCWVHAQNQPIFLLMYAAKIAFRQARAENLPISLTV